MARTPYYGMPMIKTMHLHHGTHENCSLPTSDYYSYNTLFLKYCPLHGIVYADTKTYGATSDRHQKWLACHFPEYAKELAESVEARKKRTGRTSKVRFTSTKDAIA